MFSNTGRFQGGGVDRRVASHNHGGGGYNSTRTGNFHFFTNPYNRYAIARSWGMGVLSVFNYLSIFCFSPRSAL